ncbi:unnamed protein product [Hymenolepis diminuta]|uniref:Uncharacterized protein n=1 Tax=Hymenolepis diminuta TaxID=6216 RepID=A0A564Y2U1_HYMDI|nr:unnamed protein product [Hymenolepis diminuta]
MLTKRATKQGQGGPLTDFCKFQHLHHVHVYSTANNVEAEDVLEERMKFHLPTDYEIELVFKIEAVSIGSLPFFLLDLHWSNHIQSDWSAANATKNEVLIGVCTPLVAMKWLMFRTSQFFHVATEVIGMMGLFRCSRMAQESATSKVKTLLKWRNGSRNDEEYTARTTAFRDMISLLGIEDTSDLISNLFVEGIDIPVEWRRWLAEAPKTAKKQPIDDKRQERPESKFVVGRSSFSPFNLVVLHLFSLSPFSATA